MTIAGVKLLLRRHGAVRDRTDQVDREPDRRLFDPDPFDIHIIIAAGIISRDAVRLKNTGAVEKVFFAVDGIPAFDFLSFLIIILVSAGSDPSFFLFGGFRFALHRNRCATVIR